MNQKFLSKIFREKRTACVILTVTKEVFSPVVFLSSNFMLKMMLFGKKFFKLYICKGLMIHVFTVKVMSQFYLRNEMSTTQ